MPRPPCLSLYFFAYNLRDPVLPFGDGKGSAACPQGQCKKLIPGSSCLVEVILFCALLPAAEAIGDPSRSAASPGHGRIEPQNRGPGESSMHQICYALILCLCFCMLSDPGKEFKKVQCGRRALASRALYAIGEYIHYTGINRKASSELIFSI